jgi:hypothetical protein
MSSLVEKLNEVLADEWACVRALRRAESLCQDPGPLEMIKRVRKDTSVGCVTLSSVIRQLNGHPTDLPSARFSLQIVGESFAETIDMAQSAQTHIIGALATLMDEPGLEPYRTALATLHQLHRENHRWLGSVAEQS